MALDLAALDARAEETREILDRWPEAAAALRSDLIVAAVNLHGYYTALETLLQRVATALDEDVPTCPTWHADLIEQMATEVPGLRPAAVPVEATSDLHELRKFRHFFRNAYVLEFDPVLIRGHAARLSSVQERVRAALDALVRHVDSAIAILAR
jgi:hypothetical protein